MGRRHGRRIVSTIRRRRGQPERNRLSRDPFPGTSVRQPVQHRRRSTSCSPGPGRPPPAESRRLVPGTGLRQQNFSRRAARRRRDQQVQRQDRHTLSDGTAVVPVQPHDDRVRRATRYRPVCPYRSPSDHELQRDLLARGTDRAADVNHLSSLNTFEKDAFSPNVGQNWRDRGCIPNGRCNDTSATSLHRAVAWVARRTTDRAARIAVKNDFTLSARSHPSRWVHLRSPAGNGFGQQDIGERRVLLRGTRCRSGPGAAAEADR